MDTMNQWNGLFNIIFHFQPPCALLAEIHEGDCLF